MIIATAVVLFCLLSNEANLVLGDIGTATSYDPPYIPTRCNGNGQDQFPPGNLFVAVSEGLWDNGAACGRRTGFNYIYPIRNGEDIEARRDGNKVVD
ncbi:hypothetical protein GH714_023901 [Hevea brasiliensis]|uniref:Expansin-like EG45 domain-containing protein n=1 Tax=Hevea brasiliensis TaxID=3981 RepID=A0A6A6LUZ5_HEVBR|nr:hypothetical protein GH714_023901 [Hevea brasiliensis]